MRLLRTMLFTPGNNWRMIQKAKDLAADAIILDLEDAVPLVEKETARIFVNDGVGLLKKAGLQVFVRVNSLATGLVEEDLEFVVQEDLDGIMLAKTESSDDIVKVSSILKGVEEALEISNGETAIMALIETAKGVQNVNEIIRTSTRLVGVAFGALDFTRDMGTTISGNQNELHYARSRIAIAATANQVQAIDTPWFDIADREGLKHDSFLAKQLGFKGKLLIHPDQIEAVNAVFTPSQESVEYSEKVVNAFKDAIDRGIGAISLDGKMIDTANYRQALDILNYANEIKDKEGK